MARTQRTTEWILGSDLPTHLQNEAKRNYPHRSVGLLKYFETDAEWLACTKFAVIDYGYTSARFNRAIKHCDSHLRNRSGEPFTDTITVS